MVDTRATEENLETMTASARGDTRPNAVRRQGPERKQALDPFFLFTYSLLGLAFALQLFLMVWMDIF